MNTLIVDDEKPARDVLRKLLNYHCPDINIIGEVATVEAAHEIITTQSLDLVLLDVEMPFATGFDLLTQLPSIDFEIIFVTGFSHYAINAIKFSALDYLLKPVSENELIEAVQKAKKEIAKKHLNQRFQNFIDNLHHDVPKKIGIPTAKGFLFVNVADIIHCEAEDRYTRVYKTNGQKILATRHLKEFEDLLMSHHFFRVHNAHLININHVEEFFKEDGTYITMSDGSQISVSRRRKNDFLQRLNTM